MPNFILALDLDDTVFNRKSETIEYNFGREFWINLINTIKEIFASYDLNFELIIITDKEHVDDLVVEAASVLLSILPSPPPLVEKGCNRLTLQYRYYVFTDGEIKIWDVADTGIWKAAEGNWIIPPKEPVLLEEALSQPRIFVNAVNHMGGEMNKSHIATKICSSHSIKHDQFLLIDDVGFLIEDCQRQGFGAYHFDSSKEAELVREEILDLITKSAKCISSRSHPFWRPEPMAICDELATPMSYYAIRASMD